MFAFKHEYTIKMMDLSESIQSQDICVHSDNYNDFTEKSRGVLAISSQIYLLFYFNIKRL